MNLFKINSNCVYFIPFKRSAKAFKKKFSVRNKLVKQEGKFAQNIKLGSARRNVITARGEREFGPFPLHL